MAKAKPTQQVLEKLAEISARMESVEDILRLILARIVLDESEKALEPMGRMREKVAKRTL